MRQKDSGVDLLGYFDNDRTADSMEVVTTVPEVIQLDTIGATSEGNRTDGAAIVDYSVSACERDAGVTFSLTETDEYHDSETGRSLGLLRLVWVGGHEGYFYELSPLTYLSDLCTATHQLAGAEEFSLFENANDAESANLEYYIAQSSGTCALCGIDDEKRGGVTHEKTNSTYHIDCFKSWQELIKHILSVYQERILAHSV